MRLDTVISESPPALTVKDRCDKCGAQAWVIFGSEFGELHMCRHHSLKFEPALVEQGFEVTVDKRDDIS